MNFSENSRVWIYQSDRPFTQQELFKLHVILQDFTSTWQAHGHELKAGYEIRYAQFIILLVDELQAAATGCSIDKSVNLMKTIGEEFGVNLFDRFNIAYKQGEEIRSVDRAQFETLIAEDAVDENTLVFNNTIQRKKELDTQWEVRFKDSWHPRIFRLPAKASL